MFSASACLTETTEEAKGTYVWTLTQPGNTFSIQCKHNLDANKLAKRKCLRQKDGTAKWGEVDTSQCSLVNVYILIVTTYIRETVTMANRKNLLITKNHQNSVSHT